MVEANPSLTSLALRVHYNVPFAVVYDMIHPVRHNLRRLVVSYHDDPPTQVTSALVRQLLDRCPNLEFLQFRADTMLSLQETHNDWKARLEHWKVMRQQQREPQLVNGRSREGPYKLKDLEISFQRMDQSHLPFIYTLLQLCPNLERIVVPDNPVETLPIFERILQDHLGCLTAIDLTYLGFSEPLEDTRIARILRATKPNQLQKVRTWGQYNEETFRSLAEHQAQSIQVIDMGGYRGHISSRGVQQVLANCPRLKIFKTGGHSPQMGYLLAEDIVQSEWVCKGLEVLEVPIGGVCRFAPGEPCPRHPNEKDPERVCRAVQRAVYRQLGQLEHLQNLDVHMYNYSELKEAQLETLEWSLASGIEETKGLRKLKSLKFFGTNHRIGIPELQWMKEHWPCLTDLSSFDVPQREQVLWLAANWRKLVPYLDEFGNLCI
ncbi:hypothetical protein BGZ73_004787 [Actinomortierella ambigua]|nr:hypothetical protein BGZ73_004787 [Actinomortierella ambigua]